MPIIGDEFLPLSFISSLFGVASIAVCVSVLGYIASMNESKIGLETYSAIVGVVGVVVLIQAAILTSRSLKMDSYFDQNWGKISIYVDKRYFETSGMGCYGGKYLMNQNSTNFYNLKCDNKNEIALMWEDEYTKNLPD